MSWMSYCCYSLLIQAAFFGLYWMQRGHWREPRWNRLYLLGALLASYTMPLLQGSWRPAIAGPLAEAWLLPDIAASAVPADLPRADWLWAALWLAGSALAIGVVARRLRAIASVVRECPHEPRQGYTLVHVPQHYPPCTFFRYVLWPGGESGGGEAILRHEAAHARQWHSLDVLLLACLKAVFWMNPLLWAYDRALKAQHEFLADREALQGASPEAYLQCLAQAVVRGVRLNYAHRFHESNIKHRIDMIKSSNPANFSWKQTASAFALAFLMGAGMACTENATVSDVQQADTEVEVEMLSKQEAEAALVPATVDGGFAVLVSALQQHLKYPEAARQAGIEGKVMVSFIIDNQGNMGSFEVKKGLGHGCDEAAVEALKAAQVRWIPATQNGKAVSQAMVLPIQFAL